MLSFQGITKRFGEVVANDNVSFEVCRGEIHALVGQNGAGKTTLISCLSGLVTPEKGEIFWRGRLLQVKNPHQAVMQGIGVIHQAVTLDLELTVAENVVIGAEPRSRGGWISWRQARARIRELMAIIGLDLSLEAVAGDLSLAQQRAVEILRLLWRKADLIILDEPTSNLGPQEIEGLCATLKQLKETGATSVLITHRLREVIAIADRVTVLREGCHVATGPVGEFPLHHLRELMFGEAVVKDSSNQPACRPSAGGETGKTVTLRLDEPGRETACAIRVGEGEVAGVIALPGNGLEELAAAAIGDHRSARLAIISESGVELITTAQHRRAGVSVVPSGHAGTSLALGLSVSENTAIGRERAFAVNLPGLSFLSYRSLERAFSELAKRFQIVAASPRQRVRELSGGNRQRLLLARELDKNPWLLILDHPGQGLDEASISDFYDKVRQQIAAREKGLFCVVLLSHDLEEVLRMADRILVMYRGRLVYEVATESVDSEVLERIGLYLSTGKDG